jgi:pyruvate formate lyase activating enzyme
LKYVYIDNLAPHEGNNTYCHRCGKPVIKRVGLKVLENGLRGGACPSCSTPIPGVWS